MMMVDDGQRGGEGPMENVDQDDHRHLMNASRLQPDAQFEKKKKKICREAVKTDPRRT